MTDGDGGLQVTAAEHPDGWGQADCAECHDLAALHQRGCTDAFDPEFLAGRVAEDGLASCSGCHGDNGVTP
jgi:hypothetical protein